MNQFDEPTENAVEPAPVPEAASSMAPSVAPSVTLTNDAKSDIADVVAQARSSAKTEVDAAASAANKLLSTAAGDVSVLLNDAEAAAVPLVLAKVPSAFQSIVGGFVQAALGGAEANANLAVNADAAKGLAYAEAEIASLQHHLDELL